MCYTLVKIVIAWTDIQSQKYYKRKDKLYFSPHKRKQFSLRHKYIVPTYNTLYSTRQQHSPAFFFSNYCFFRIYTFILFIWLRSNYSERISHGRVIKDKVFYCNLQGLHFNCSFQHTCVILTTCIYGLQSNIKERTHLQQWTGSK